MSAKNDVFAIAYLHECFRYDCETGVLTWRIRPRHHFKTKRACSTWNARYAETVAGTERVNGRTSYKTVVLDYVRLRVHRVAFAMFHEEWPDADIDHFDGVGTHNWISNLRPSSRSQNERNRRLSADNTSGFNGVYWDKFNNKWRAQIAMNKRVKALGRFADIHSAVAAREAAEHGHGFTKRHGKEE